jgi:glutamate synthase (NADPH) small chain
VSLADKFNKMKQGFDYGQAIEEADRCLLCLDPPCSKGCPADTDPGTFIRKLRFKNITGAIRTIKENNIMGGACGILCPVDRLCEKECSAQFKSNLTPGGSATAIQIGKIQRFLVEHSWERGFQVFSKPESTGQKVAVIGSGPGGLSCAAELAKAGVQVTVFEARPEPGGVLRYGVNSFRFETKFLERELEDIKGLGVQFKCNSKIEDKAAAENLLKDGFDAVFLAPGLWQSAPLNPNQSEIKGLYGSVDYLSALRDGRLEEMGQLVKGKSVAIIGGGAVAMDCITSALRLGANDVYLIYRRSFAQMPAEKPERMECLEEGAHFLLLNQPLGYITNENNQLTGMKLLRTKLGQPDESGRRRPINIDGSEWELDIDIVVEAIGNQAEQESGEWYPNVEINDKNLIKSNPETGETSVPGIFAGGDIVRGPSLVVNAVQDGKIAARSIQKHLAK